MSKWKNNEILVGTCRFAVQVRVKHAAGTGFAGMGAGWTSPTRAVPVCHPNCEADTRLLVQILILYSK